MSIQRQPGYIVFIHCEKHACGSQASKYLRAAVFLGITISAIELFVSLPRGKESEVSPMWWCCLPVNTRIPRKEKKEYAC